MSQKLLKLECDLQSKYDEIYENNFKYPLELTQCCSSKLSECEIKEETVDFTGSDDEPKTDLQEEGDDRNKKKLPQKKCKGVKTKLDVKTEVYEDVKLDFTNEDESNLYYPLELSQCCSSKLSETEIKEETVDFAESSDELKTDLQEDDRNNKGVKRKLNVPECTYVSTSDIESKEEEEDESFDPLTVTERDIQRMQEKKKDVIPDSQEVEVMPLDCSSQPTQDTPEEISEDEAEGSYPQPHASFGAKRHSNLTRVTLSERGENDVIEWLHQHPILYDKKRREFKNVELKWRLYKDKAKHLTPPLTAKQLKVWCDGMRTRYGRLTDVRSGAGAEDICHTYREKWVIDTFGFLKSHIVRNKTRATAKLDSPVDAAAEAPHATPLVDPTSDQAGDPRAETGESAMEEILSAHGSIQGSSRGSKRMKDPQVDPEIETMRVRIESFSNEVKALLDSVRPTNPNQKPQIVAFLSYVSEVAHLLPDSVWQRTCQIIFGVMHQAREQAVLLQQRQQQQPPPVQPPLLPQQDTFSQPLAGPSTLDPFCGSNSHIWHQSGHASNATQILHQPILLRHVPPVSQPILL